MGGKSYHQGMSMTITTMTRNGVTTQQSCEHRDAHDVFFPSGLLVKQQQIQCQTPQKHLRADRRFAKTESSGARASTVMIRPWVDLCTETHQSSQNQQHHNQGIMPWMKRPMHQYT